MKCAGATADEATSCQEIDGQKGGCVGRCGGEGRREERAERERSEGLGGRETDTDEATYTHTHTDHHSGAHTGIHTHTDADIEWLIHEFMYACTHTLSL